MQVIVWTADDGTVSLLRPAPGASLDDIVASAAVPKDRAHFVIDDATLPLPPSDPAFGAVRLDAHGALSIDQAVYAALTVQQQVPVANFVRALDQKGLLTQVTAAVDAAGDLAKALWLQSSYFRRDDPLVAQIGAAVGQSSAQLDDLFKLATTFP
jgi:hypothetical protein